MHTQSNSLADTAKLLGIFLEIDEICVHARTVDTRPSFPPRNGLGTRLSMVADSRMFSALISGSLASTDLTFK